MPNDKVRESRICFERIVPAALEAAGTKFWPPGSILRISFLDGEAVVQKQVREVAKEWTRHANIQFDFTPDLEPEAHIRISFRARGSWSAVGRDALNEALFPKGTPTMNYGWLTPASLLEDYSVVLHEFGHALGLVHEHQSPGSAICWNRNAVIKDLLAAPNYWDLATIEHNVLNKYENVTITQYTQFDPKSIMLYTFPSHWTLDGMEFPENKVLSETDITFIKQQYPK